MDKVWPENNSGNTKTRCKIIIHCMFFIVRGGTKDPVMGIVNSVHISALNKMLGMDAACKAAAEILQGLTSRYA